MTKEERLEDIRKHPDKHRHGVEGLPECCLVNGALDITLLEAHQANFSVMHKAPDPCRISIAGNPVARQH